MDTLNGPTKRRENNGHKDKEANCQARQLDCLTDPPRANRFPNILLYRCKSVFDHKLHFLEEQNLNLRKLLLLHKLQHLSYTACFHCTVEQ